MAELVVEGYTIIFIDESNFSNVKHNFKTWVPMDEKVNNYYPGRIKSVSLMMAVTLKGLFIISLKQRLTKVKISYNFLMILIVILKMILSSKIKRTTIYSGFIVTMHHSIGLKR
jgi:hypothetical protein